MPIRQVTSSSIKDGEIAQADFASSVSFGAGFFKVRTVQQVTLLLVRVTSFV